MMRSWISRYLKSEATPSGDGPKREWKATSKRTNYRSLQHRKPIVPMAAESGLDDHAAAGHRLHLAGVDCPSRPSATGIPLPGVAKSPVIAIAPHPWSRSPGRGECLGARRLSMAELTVTTFFSTHEDPTERCDHIRRSVEEPGRGCDHISYSLIFRSGCSGACQAPRGRSSCANARTSGRPQERL